MIISVGDKIRTNFCTGVVVAIIDGKTKPGWRDQPHFEIKVTSPVLPKNKRKQIIRMDEVKLKLC